MVSEKKSVFDNNSGKVKLLCMITNLSTCNRKISVITYPLGTQQNANLIMESKPALLNITTMDEDTVPHTSIDIVSFILLGIAVKTPLSLNVCKCVIDFGLGWLGLRPEAVAH